MKRSSDVRMFPLCLWLLAAVVPAYAIDPMADIPPPSAPLVAPVPDRAHWVVNLTPDNTKSATASAISHVQQVEVIKTGDIKNDVISYNDGTKDVYWYVGSHALTTESFDKTKIGMDEFAMDPNGGKGSPVRSLGFTGVSWVNGACFDKVVTYQQAVCYHYIFPGESGVEAWIRVKDKMPVAYHMDGVLYVYTFENPPADKLVLPPAYQKLVDAAQKKAAYENQLLKDLPHH